jgi:hypothetical protein
MRCPTGNGRGQFTTVKANNSEKSKTVCNNSYIRKTGPTEEENTFGTRGKRQIYPESSHRSKVQGVFKMTGQISSMSSSYLNRDRKKAYTCMFGKDLFLSLKEKLRSAINILMHAWSKLQNLKYVIFYLQET